MTITCGLCHGSGTQTKSGKQKTCTDCHGVGIIEVQRVEATVVNNEVVYEPVLDPKPAPVVDVTMGTSLWQKIKNWFPKA